MILFLDNYDSFSNNILKKINFKNLILNFLNLNIKKINLNYFIEKIIILGPGPGNVENSNLHTIVIDKFLGKKKFLGVCLGHQIISCYFGYKLYKLNIINHGELKKVIFYIKKYKLFIVKKFIFYNSLSCLGLNNFLFLLKNNFEIFIIKNLFLKIKSFQFHSESIMSYKNILL